MSKCLVTKLNGSSNNSELLRLGEMRIGISKVDSPNHWTQGFNITVNKLTVLEIIGDGYFTDVNLTANNGKKITLNPNVAKKVYVSNGNFEVAVLDKYALVSIWDYDAYSAGNSEYSQKNKSISDIGFFKYSTALTNISLVNTQISGDIANLKNLTALTSLSINSTQISGDIANLKNLTALTSLSINSTQISGDIANLKNLTALTRLKLPNTQVSGDIANLKTLTSLTGIELPNTQVSGDIANLKTLTSLTGIELSNKQIPLTGEISALSTLSKCKTISLQFSKLTGDLAILPDACYLASLYYDKGSVFTWSTRPSSAYIISLGQASLSSNVDKMLQDQAQCQVGLSVNKIISVTGTRTSASDAAVSTLQQKGYTVSITHA